MLTHHGNVSSPLCANIPSISKPVLHVEPRYCTRLEFMNNKWVPIDLQGMFVDLRDSHFSSTNKVRVFPKSCHLSFLGSRYTISKVMQIDAWRSLGTI
ncbi:hypothetical protein BD408DRAFT_342109 [Parasitella parasitica]|nr:hypothetical protein BD408DRAFT_342109 [Parasitella parasitica]